MDGASPIDGRGVFEIKLSLSGFGDDAVVMLEAIWWLLFSTGLGLCIGSFLNVVIFRLPRERSLSDPLWSFCPGCRRPIRWYDNLPVLSFLLLGGRCRTCGVPISTQYPVIEISMALIVLMLLDAFSIGQVRAGLSGSTLLTDRIAYDWPLLVAHIVLFACLLSMSAIDLGHYWVDVRFTNFATVVGFVGHALWTPRHSYEWTKPGDSTAIVCLCALVGLGVVWVWSICQPNVDVEELGEPDVGPAPLEIPQSPPPQRRPPPSLASGSRLAGWGVGVVWIGLLVCLFLDAATDLDLRHVGRAMVPLVLFFSLVVWESLAKRPADQAIADAIEAERHGARRMVLREFVFFIPALLAGVAGFALMAGDGEFAHRLAEGLHWSARVSDMALLRNWSPLSGVATAATGYIIAGALGWSVRIVFTLVFGKEAFGTGDIHMMAAAGCVAGWPVVVLGFPLACFLAMLGWIAALPFKRSRAVPLGPWLSLSFLAVVVFYNSILQWPFVDRVVRATQMLTGVGL